MDLYDIEEFAAIIILTAWIALCGYFIYLILIEGEDYDV
jgi:hypothetical protein